MTKKLAIILILALFLGGCSIFSTLPSIYDGEVQEIETAASFAINLPDGWEVQLDEQVYFSAISSEGNLGISVIAEYGGFTFYNMQELGEKVLEYTDLENLQVAHVQTGLNESTQLHQILTCTDADGNSVVIDNYIFSPYTSVVYYVFLTASASDYELCSKQFSEILNSFKLTKNREEFYGMIEEILTSESEDADTEE